MALPRRDKAVRLGKTSAFNLCFDGGETVFTHKDLNNCILENITSPQLLRGLHPSIPPEGHFQGDLGSEGWLPSAHPSNPWPGLGAHAHSPVRQSGFHGAHGVEGRLHGEFPGGVALAALLMSEQQQAAKLLAPGGQQGYKEGQDGQWEPRPPTTP